MKSTAKTEIIKKLAMTDKPLSVHEFDLPLYSQTNISARLRELAREGVVISQRVPGKAYKSWSLVFRLELL